MSVVRGAAARAGPTAAGINVLAGIWLIIAPFVLGYGNGDPYWNDIFFGAIVGLIGSCARPAPTASRGSAGGTRSSACGSSPRHSGSQHRQTAIDDVILGAIVAVLGLVAATASEEGAAAAPPPEGTGTPRW
jgi:hypothetical protein